MQFAGKQVLVLGLGESGLAIARWLAHCDARVRVADTRESPERLPALHDTVLQAEFIGGEFSPALLDGVELVVVSPGLAPHRELAVILPAAQEKIYPSGARSSCLRKRCKN